MVLWAFLLSACGPSSTSTRVGKIESTAPPGAENGVNNDSLPGLTLPPGAETRPLSPGQTGAAKDANGLPILKPMGVNTNLFIEKLKDPDDRLDRLENAVQEMRNDFDAMAPSIVRLVAIEKDIQSLISQLEVLTGGEQTPQDIGQDALPVDLDQPVEKAEIGLARIDSAALQEDVPQTMAPISSGVDPPIVATPPPAQETAKTAPKYEVKTKPVPAPQPDAHLVAVKSVRIGEHPGKTRIVLDMDGKAGHKLDLDNQEKILVVDLPGTGWKAALQNAVASSPTLLSYRAEPSDTGGTMLIFQLKAAVSVAYDGTMENSDGAGQRIVIDLSPSAPRK